MPSESSAVGALTLPLAAGSTDEVIADPVCAGLADYLAWSLNTDLSARLAQHQAVGDVAVPTGAAYDYSPYAPQGHRVKLPVPALFVWTPDQSDVQREWTLVYRVREREVRVLYVWQERPELSQWELRPGMANAVSASLHKAAQRQRHPSYGYGTDPNGTPLYQSLATVGVLAWEMVGAAPARIGLGQGPAAPETNRPRTSKGRDFPCVVAKLKVTERIEHATPADPGDVLGDLTVSIAGSDGETSECIDLFDRVCGSPDGSAELD